MSPPRCPLSPGLEFGVPGRAKMQTPRLGVGTACSGSESASRARHLEPKAAGNQGCEDFAGHHPQFWERDTGRRRSRSEEHTSELQSPCNLVCRLLLEKKKTITKHHPV